MTGAAVVDIRDLELAAALAGIAAEARELVPDAVTVRLETSDQGHHLAVSGEAIVGADGRTYGESCGGYAGPLGPDVPLEPGALEAMDEWACGITWGQAASCDLPGWRVINARGGYYEFDVEAAVVGAPTWKERLAAAARDLLELIEREVPSNVAHYAVEDARHAMRVLSRLGA